MHLPDHEIVELEQRLAQRRAALESAARETGRRAVRSLASPAVLAGVVVLGFLAGAGVGRRRPARQDRRAAAKTGLAGLLVTGALWLLRQQLGNPARIAQFVLARVKQYRSAAQERPASPRGDSPAYR
jgi:hypothetical protein